MKINLEAEESVLVVLLLSKSVLTNVVWLIWGSLDLGIPRQIKRISTISYWKELIEFL